MSFDISEHSVRRGCVAAGFFDFQPSPEIGTFLRLWRSIRMPQHNNAMRERVERIFKAREERKADAPKAIAEYYEAEKRLRERTQELRQLRLKREAQTKLRSA